MPKNLDSSVISNFIAHSFPSGSMVRMLRTACVPQIVCAYLPFFLPGLLLFFNKFLITLQAHFLFFFFFFEGGCHDLSIWRFLGQGSDSCHSNNQSPCRDNARSLTHCSTREIPSPICLMFTKMFSPIS